MKKRSKLTLEPRLRLTGARRFAFGPGQAALLEGIDQTGSITEAAKAMGMSYMRAWLLVKNMNRGFMAPLVETVRGGRQRGGAQLSAIGGQVLRLYREMEARSRRATRPGGQKLARMLRA